MYWGNRAQSLYESSQAGDGRVEQVLLFPDDHVGEEMSACGVCVHLHAFKLELQASSWLAEILTPRLKAYPSLMCTMLLAEPHETLCRSQLQPAGTKHCCLGLRCRPFTSRLLPARQRLHRNEVGLRSPSAEEGDNKGKVVYCKSKPHISSLQCLSIAICVQEDISKTLNLTSKTPPRQ